MHTIQAVADRTGLTPDVIRVWERRYQAVTPVRTVSNQRNYSDEDILRLALLKQLTDAGLRISNVAAMQTPELQDLLTREQDNYLIGTTPLPAQEKIHFRLEACYKAILEMEAAKLDVQLQAAVIELGTVGFLTRFVNPLLVQVGDQWRCGNLRTCQEHFSSAHLRSFLGRYMLEAHPATDGPRIIVATPPGHSHELGALMAALVASQSGWSVVYLGASVPVEELAYCADCKDARAVALSVSYPSDDPRLPTFMEQLREQLPASTPLIVGGASSRFYLNTLKHLGVSHLDDLGRFSTMLDEIRNERHPN